MPGTVIGAGTQQFTIGNPYSWGFCILVMDTKKAMNILDEFINQGYFGPSENSMTGELDRDQQGSAI